MTQLGDIRGPYRKRSISERLQALSIPEPNTGCVLWFGSTAGMMEYGKIGVSEYVDGEHRKHTRMAHVVAWELKHGPVPVGLELDHKCKTPCCINDEHLEPVTHRENQRRGSSIVARKMAQTDCDRGHPLTGDNLYMTPDGRRQCRACARLRAAQKAR